MKRNAKIIATIGPASESPEMLQKMIENGMNVARLNFSHGTHSEHQKKISKIRNISNKIGKSVAIIQDLQGPKMRIGDISEGKIELKRSEIVYFTHSNTVEKLQKEHQGKKIIPFDLPDFTKNFHVGNRILLDDGNLEMIVSDIKDDFIAAEVVIDGFLSSHKGVNLPGAPLQFSSFTEKDQTDLLFGLENDIDAIALSFVHNADDITRVKQFIKRNKPGRSDIPIIAKLERPEAMDNLKEILEVTDGVMVARGDLAVETSPSVVPIMQKRIIEEANAMGKFVITATQMLDSMIHNPRPTRAEASDVANAIFDGTDAVMLSGETAMGAYPIESIIMMENIIIEAEQHIKKWGHELKLAEPEFGDDDAISITRAAKELACDRDVSRIAVFTLSGRTALLISKNRPHVPIFAFTSNASTFTLLNMYWGVRPFLVPFSNTFEDMLNKVESSMLSTGSIEEGQQVVLISGFPVGEMRTPNLALLHTIKRKN